MIHNPTANIKWVGALSWGLMAGVGQTDAPVPPAWFLEFAATHHPHIVRAQAELDKARATVSGSRAAWAPALTVGSKGVADSLSSDNMRVNTRTASWFSTELEQLIWDFGKANANTRAALKAVAAREADLAEIRSGVFLGVMERYLESVLAIRMEALRRATLENRQGLKSRIERLVQTGVRPKSDLTSASVDVENARMSLISVRAAIRNTREQLRQAASLESIDGIDLADMLDVLPAIPSQQNWAAMADQRRSELLAARWAIKARQEEKDAVRRQYYPALTANAGVDFGRLDIRSDDETAPDSNYPYNDAFVQVRLGWAGWNPLAVRADLRKADAALRQTEADLRQISADVRTQVAVAENNLNEARERVRVAEAVCAAASENVTLILRRYESGVSSILDVTDSQMKLTQAEETRLQARADVWLFDVRLRQAVGLTVWDPAASPTPPVK